MSARFDPYQAWLGIGAAEQPPNYYRLLGLTLFESDHAHVEHAAQRQLAKVSSMAAPQHAAVAKAVTDEIIMARNVLLSPAAKQAYDRRLQAHAGGSPPRAIVGGQSREPKVAKLAAPPSSSAPQRTTAPAPRQPAWRQPLVVLSTAVALAVVAGIAVMTRSADELDREPIAAGSHNAPPPTAATAAKTEKHPNSDDAPPRAKKASKKPKEPAARGDSETTKPAAEEPIRELATSPKAPAQKTPALKTPKQNETVAPTTLEAKLATGVPAAQPKRGLLAEPSEATLADGSVVKLDTYGETFQGYDWRPPITLYSPELHTVLDFRLLHGFGSGSLNFDLEHDRMYWCTYVYNHRAGRIQRAKLDGSNVEDLITNLEECRALAVDFARGKMFWTELLEQSNQNWVKSADLDGKNIQTIVPGAVSPDAIALNPQTGEIYFCESPNERHIHRIRPDGSGETSIIRGTERLGLCDRIIVNSAADKLYWI